MWEETRAPRENPASSPAREKHAWPGKGGNTHAPEPGDEAGESPRLSADR